MSVIIRFPVPTSGGPSHRRIEKFKRAPTIIEIVIEQRADGSCALGWNENIPITRDGMRILSDALTEALEVIKHNYFNLP